MAEFVAQSVAQIKSELEPLKFLTLEEKKIILKKRERYEYRLRKRRKQEKDYLLYIQYEKDVLKFFKIRKKGIRTKLRPEVPVIMRIHQLYQLCETNFPHSVETWLQHIEFCKKQKEYRRVGRLYNQMLKSHGTKPELFIQAATWEVEQSNLDGARSLMQRCVNSNKTSLIAWVEFYKMELELAKAMRGTGEDINESDPTVNGAIAQLIYGEACRRMPDNVDVRLSFIEISDKYDFTQNHKEEMLEQLREEFSHVPRVWDFLARRLLPTENNKLKRVSESQEEMCCSMYQQAITHNPCREMWTLYLKACLQLLALREDSSDRVHQRMSRALELFQTAADENLLAEDMFPSWITLLSQGSDGGQLESVCELMVKRFPDSVQAWTHRLELHCLALNPPQRLLNTLYTALHTVAEKEAWSLWRPVLLYLQATDYEHMESVVEKACLGFVKEVVYPAKVFYMKWTSITKDINDVRQLYERMRTQRPVPLDFYLEYIKREFMEDNVKMKKIRKAFEHAVAEHGQNNPDVWLSYVEMEKNLRYGNPVMPSQLHARAIVNLPPGPVQEAFVLRYSALMMDSS